MKIFCIGNKHVEMFKGNDFLGGEHQFPIFETHNLQRDTINNFLESTLLQIINIVQSVDFNKDQDYIMFVLGEYDCRWSINDESIQNNENVDSVIENYATKYLLLMQYYLNQGYKIICWGAQIINTFGSSGDCSETAFADNVSSRNNVPLKWNTVLKNKCFENNIPFLSIFEMLTSLHFLDSIHLNGKMIIPFLIEQIPDVISLPHISFSFVISEYKSAYINKMIDSIEVNNIPEYEIIVVGNPKLTRNNTKIIPFNESQKKAWITRKKNIGINNAKYENVIVTHDYIKFDYNWYNGFRIFGTEYDWGVNCINNNKGERFRDYTVLPRLILPITDSFRQRALLPYNMKNNERINKFLYISGSYYFIKRNIALCFPLNETLGWGESEDVELTQTLDSNKFMISMNMYSKISFFKNKPSTTWEKMIDDEQKNLLLTL
jgi:hypothetical protein